MAQHHFLFDYQRQGVLKEGPDVTVGTPATLKYISGKCHPPPIASVVTPAEEAWKTFGGEEEPRKGPAVGLRRPERSSSPFVTLLKLPYQGN